MSDVIKWALNVKDVGEDENKMLGRFEISWHSSGKILHRPPYYNTSGSVSFICTCYYVFLWK